MMRQKPDDEVAQFDDFNSSKVLTHLRDKQFCKEFNSLFREIISQEKSVVPDLNALILIINNSFQRGTIGTVINILGKIPKPKEGMFTEKNPWEISSQILGMDEVDRTSHLMVLLKPFENKMSYFSFIFTTSAMEIIIPKCLVVNAPSVEIDTSSKEVNASPEVVNASPEVVNASPEVVNASPEVVNASPEVVNASPEVTDVLVASYAAHPDNQPFIPPSTYQPFIIVLQVDPFGLTIPLYLSFNRIILECYVDVIYYIPFYSTAENPNYLIGFSPRNGRVDMQLNDSVFISTYSAAY